MFNKNSKNMKQSDCEPKFNTFVFNGLSKNEQKNIFLYFIVLTVLVEFAITIAAIIYTVTSSIRLANGDITFFFPWLAYFLGLAISPLALILLFKLVLHGFSHSVSQQTEIEQHLPDKIKVLFALVRGAPAFILLIGIILIGLIIYYIDGFVKLFFALKPNIHIVAIWIICAVAVAFVLSVLVKAYVSYQTKKMEAEFAFKRDVLEKTGQIILDSRQALGGDQLQALEQETDKEEKYLGKTIHIEEQN